MLSAVSEVSHHEACRARIGTVSATMRELSNRCKLAPAAFRTRHRLTPSSRPALEPGRNEESKLWSQAVELPSLVLLGCRLGRRGTLSRPAERRAARAAEAFRTGLSPHVLACGGKAWFGVREADALAAFLVEAGVPEAAVERELWSRSTRENAHFAAKLLLPRGLRRVGLVTCDWHMARALRCFEAAGFEPLAVPAFAPGLRGFRAVLQVARERVSFAVDSALTHGFSRL